jgi:2-oxoisovalerate dehydrogenase E2 component (dihydrolipoyl transacylase)
MIFTVRMPQYTETMVDGIVSRWLKAEGDSIGIEEPLVEIITDKVTVEMPSPVEGVVSRIAFAEETVVPVGEVIAQIRSTLPQTDATDKTLSSPQIAKPPVASRDGAAQAIVRRHSPMVRKLAEKHNVDLEQVSGSGRGDRITKEDVLAHIAERSDGPVASGPAEEGRRLEVSPVRRLIADHMSKSVQVAPHAWGIVDVDVTALVSFRNSMKDRFKRDEGVSLTFLPFFVRAVAAGLVDSPELNSTWSDDGIVLKTAIHIGMAVGASGGLVVPVLRDADTKSVRELAREVASLSHRAREGKLIPSDVGGATFTVNNSGALGYVLSMPIIHQPQAGILNTDAIVKRPVVMGDDAIVVRSTMYMTLGFDHRILDGVGGSRFLNFVKSHLERYGPDSSID